MRLKNYLNNDTNDIENIIETVVFMEEFNQLDEGISDFKDRIKGILPKLGIHAHKTGPGLIQILGKAGSTMTKFFWYAMKAATGDEEAKAKVKELANKEIHKEDVLDFLLRLDTVSMHLVSGPIHMIDALTGWHIGAHTNKVKDGITIKIKKAIEYLEDVAKTAVGRIKQKIVQYINGIKNLAIA